MSSAYSVGVLDSVPGIETSILYSCSQLENTDMSCVHLFYVNDFGVLC